MSSRELRHADINDGEVLFNLFNVHLINTFGEFVEKVSVNCNTNFNQIGRKTADKMYRRLSDLSFQNFRVFRILLF